MNWVVSKENIVKDTNGEWKKLFPWKYKYSLVLFQSEFGELKGLFSRNHDSGLGEGRFFRNTRQIYVYASKILTFDEAVDELLKELAIYLKDFEEERSELKELGFECLGYNHYQKGCLILEKSMSLVEGVKSNRVFMNGSMVSKNRSLVSFLKHLKKKSTMDFMSFSEEMRDLICQI